MVQVSGSRTRSAQRKAAREAPWLNPRTPWNGPFSLPRRTEMQLVEMSQRTVCSLRWSLGDAPAIVANQRERRFASFVEAPLLVPPLKVWPRAKQFCDDGVRLSVPHASARVFACYSGGKRGGKGKVEKKSDRGGRWSGWPVEESSSCLGSVNAWRVAGSTRLPWKCALAYPVAGRPSMKWYSANGGRSLVCGTQ